MASFVVRNVESIGIEHIGCVARLIFSFPACNSTHYINVERYACLMKVEEDMVIPRLAYLLAKYVCLSFCHDRRSIIEYELLSQINRLQGRK